MLRTIIFVVALLIASAPLRAEVIKVDVARFEQLRAKGVPVIDLRTPEEWSATGVIEGSHLVTFADAGGPLRRRWVGVAACGNRCSGRTHCAHLLEWKAEQHRRTHPEPTVRLRADLQRARRDGAMDCGRPGDRPPLSSLTGSDSGSHYTAIGSLIGG